VVYYDETMRVAKKPKSATCLSYGLKARRTPFDRFPRNPRNDIESFPIKLKREHGGGYVAREITMKIFDRYGIRVVIDKGPSRDVKE